VAAPKKTTTSARTAKKTADAAPAPAAKKRAVPRAIPNPETSRPTLASSHRKSTPALPTGKVAAKAEKPAKPAKPVKKAAAKAPAKKAAAEKAEKATAKGVAAKAAPKGAELPLPARVRKAKVEAKNDAAAELGKALALGALEKKASQVEVVDVRGRLDYADVVVLASGRSDRQAVAIAQGMEDEAKKRLGRRTLSVEGVTKGQWILLDFGDVVAHVFTEEARHLYDLDGLFTDADKIPV
jgi:ribosome-associated protein